MKLFLATRAYNKELLGYFYARDLDQAKAWAQLNLHGVTVNITAPKRLDK